MTPIYTIAELKAIENETLSIEGITNDELMEHAAKVFVKKLLKLRLELSHIKIFCGFGNNGGDGLAIARLLYKKGYPVSVFALYNVSYSAEWQLNYERLKTLPVSIAFINSIDDLPTLSDYTLDDIIIDALWSYGLNRPLTGIGADAVIHINRINALKVAVDIPSGISADSTNEGPHIIADYTITFEGKKRMMYLAPEAEACGEISIAPLEFQPEALITMKPHIFETTDDDIKSLIRPRNPYSHKRDYGHVYIIAGSTGMSGAAALCSKACVKGGAGLTTAITSATSTFAVLMHTPETMTIVGGEAYIDQITIAPSATVIAAGPGMGKALLTTLTLKHALAQHASLPWIIDADALNVIAENQWLTAIPTGSILTPHAGEFDRLFGKHTHDNDRINTAISKAALLQSVIVLKGHHTAIINTNGDVYFNTTGNASLAKGGSGDVLTGLLAALRAQQYNAIETALMGVYLHGLAAQLASEELTEYCVTALNIISYLPHAFKSVI